MGEGGAGDFFAKGCYFFGLRFDLNAKSVSEVSAMASAVLEDQVAAKVPT